jgi:hypothetical protein
MTDRGCRLQAISVARKWLEDEGSDLSCQPAFREGCAFSFMPLCNSPQLDVMYTAAAVSGS